MRKTLFIDRDGTLICEPADEQVDSLGKLEFVPGVFKALQVFQQEGFRLVMVTNQDGLGTDSFPQRDFEIVQNKMLQIFNSQGIEFEEIYVCPHFAKDYCTCRKPKIGLFERELIERRFDPELSWVIGDRDSDIELATNLEINSFRIDPVVGWGPIVRELDTRSRSAQITRETKETQIEMEISTAPGAVTIQTGLSFFDHMLEQIFKHGGFSGRLVAKGDLEIDAHHTIEDVAIVMGQAFSKILEDRLGIERYGFYVPMDEACSSVVLDLVNRMDFVFEGSFEQSFLGELPTQMIPHFFKSFAQNLPCTLHVSIKGSNDHHKVESAFKALGRAIKMGMNKTNRDVVSTKGLI